MAKLRHDNVVKFEGFIMEYGNLSLVFEWQYKESVRGYIHRYPDCDPLRIVCGTSLPDGKALVIVQTSGIAEGLAYVHKLRIVHCNLKGVRLVFANILLRILLSLLKV